MVTKIKSPKKSKVTVSRKQPVTSKSFLLEIGTEEIPTNILPQTLQDLADLGQQLLSESRLAYKHLRTVGTSRRLALLVDGLQLKQPSLTREVTGPPKAAAFDASGSPTKAALGFAKSQGVSVEQLTIKQTPKGLYLVVEKHESGQSSKQVLTSLLPHFLAKMVFSKAMRWNSSQVKFARPIRWIAVLLGNQALKIEFAGLVSGGVTWGHRYFRINGKKTAQKVSLTNAANYIALMKKKGVLVDPNERRAEITSQIAKLAKFGKGQIDPLYRQDLIEEAVWGVERPHAILGGFPKEFLALPKPVLISSMKEHQGFLSLVGKDGGLLPKFIAITNTPWGNTKLITKGNERVLAARLKDAQYFFLEDQKQPLHARVQALEGIIFHHKLGTMRQKVERIQDLAGWIAMRHAQNDLSDLCRRAGLLSKADLTTGMVGEFPNLQGVMGEVYARHDGESQEVCQAIGEHYLPRFPDDSLPTSSPGLLVACADRCDSIASFFSVGMVPTGSEDPLGLRRAAYGLVRIVSETPLRMNLVDVFDQMIQILKKQGIGQEQPKIVSEIMGFIMDRLRFYGRTTVGLRDDVMEAVIRVRPHGTGEVGDLLSRMRAVQSMVGLADFETLMVGFKRAHRIVEKERWNQTGVSPELFQHESEPRLFQVFEKAQQEVSNGVATGDYPGALKSLLTFKSAIDEFFAAVLVNDPENAIRENRLSLLTAIDRVFLDIADFSCIQSAGSEVG